jgi:glycosyltransferase involved in cell wall biosynthesis
LVIVGSEPDKEYAAMCREEANDKVLFLPPIPHDSDMLRSAFVGAKTFALPSYYEMPGLTALEAGLSGVNLVISKNGGTKEYFDRYASYVDPEDVSDIARGIKNACARPRNEALSERIRTKYTWDRVVELTLKAYSSLDQR